MRGATGQGGFLPLAGPVAPPAHGARELDYRPDIDGLRAISVLCVVLYHGGAKWLGGGFLGVDIFFVISGFLITSILLREQARGDFSLGRFYLRRAKRLIPVLAAVIACTLAAGWFLLLPSEFQNLGMYVTAASLFSANLALWIDSGYFAGAAELLPLRHLWSLAVEEQFYLLWPSLLLLAGRFSLNLQRAAGLLLLASFALSCVAVVIAPSAAFLLLPTRAWELLMGCMLALVPRRPGPLAAHLAAAVGLLLVLGAAVLLDDQGIPGWKALFPCVGAALLILAGPGALPNRLLASRPLVFVGLISYSLYLWHWPMLSIARSAMTADAFAAARPYLVLAAFPVAAASWRWIEQPFRARSATAFVAAPLIRYAGLSALLLLAGLLTYLGQGFPHRVDPVVAAVDGSPYGVGAYLPACRENPFRDSDTPDAECLVKRGSGHAGLVVWGDSHARALAPGLDAWLARRQESLAVLSMNACPPLLGVSMDIDPQGKCAHFNSKVMSYLSGPDRSSTVVLMGRWAYYAENSGYGPEDGARPAGLRSPGGDTHPAGGSAQILGDALEKTIKALVAAGHPVVVIGPIPEMGIDVRRCVAKSKMPLGGDRQCSLPASTFAARSRRASQILAALDPAGGRVCSVWPGQWLCDTEFCRGYRDGELLYMDDDHLNMVGATKLVARLGLERCFAGP